MLVNVMCFEVKRVVSDWLSVSVCVCVTSAQ